jgi:hypothetical protein
MTTPQLDRPRFYEQQYLGSADLSAVVDYGRVRLARHVLGGHTWGIAMGLDLVAKDSPAAPGTKDVLIQPGFAWDGFGRPIVMLAPCRLSAGMFQNILYDPAVPNGISVEVWLRYDESLTGAPAAGYDACDVECQFSRIEETYRVEVGPRSVDRQRSKLDVAGRSIDAEAALSAFDAARGALWDTSVPQQNFPEDGVTVDWLVPIGMVHWQPDPDPSVPGQLSLTAAEAIPGERFRRDAGVVAGSVLAMGANTRFRRREVAPSTDWSDDLVWVEGALRVQGGARLFGCTLDLLTASGQDNGALLRVSRIENNASGGHDLGVQIGAAQAGNNRLVIGPMVGAALDNCLVVLDSTQVGIGEAQPKETLHIHGSVRGLEDVLNGRNGQLRISTASGWMDVGAQNAGWAHFYTSMPLYYFDKGIRVDTGEIGSYNEDLSLQTQGTTRLTVLNATGYLGVGTTAPLNILHVARTGHLNAIFESSDWSEHLTLVVGASGSGLRFSDTNSFFIGTQSFGNRNDGSFGNPELLHLTAAGSMGLGTNSPTARLEVRGSVRLGVGGTLFAPGCLDDLRVIAGRVGSNGSVQLGAGFLAHRNNTGNYTVTYLDPFPSTPVVLATPFDPGGFDNTINVITSSSTAFTVDIRDTDTGSDEDDDFNFVVFGLK